MGGLKLYRQANRTSREQALRLWTQAAGWFANDDDERGMLKAGQLADLAVLSEDYFAVPERGIPGIESLLTLLGGKVVHAAGPFARSAPPALPIRPDWSPVGVYGGYHRTASSPLDGRRPTGGSPRRQALSRHVLGGCQDGGGPPWGAGCGCWAF